MSFTDLAVLLTTIASAVMIGKTLARTSVPATIAAIIAAVGAAATMLSGIEPLAAIPASFGWYAATAAAAGCKALTAGVKQTMIDKIAAAAANAAADTTDTPTGDDLVDRTDIEEPTGFLPPAGLILALEDETLPAFPPPATSPFAADPAEHVLVSEPTSAPAPFEYTPAPDTHSDGIVFPDPPRVDAPSIPTTPAFSADMSVAEIEMWLEIKKAHEAVSA